MESNPLESLVRPRWRAIHGFSGARAPVSTAGPVTGSACGERPDGRRAAATRRRMPGSGWAENRTTVARRSGPGFSASGHAAQYVASNDAARNSDQRPVERESVPGVGVGARAPGFGAQDAPVLDGVDAEGSEVLGPSGLVEGEQFSDRLDMVAPCVVAATAVRLRRRWHSDQRSRRVAAAVRS